LTKSFGLFPQREIGWHEIGEEFTRWTLLWTPWFTIYLHRLVALKMHPQCHDHPWGFIAVLLKGGYWEFHDGLWEWKRPGSVLIRPAEWSHNVVTDENMGVSWSMIITGPKRREWGFQACHD
jgi:hypothetical protein